MDSSVVAWNDHGSEVARLAVDDHVRQTQILQPPRGTRIVDVMIPAAQREHRNLLRETPQMIRNLDPLLLQRFARKHVAAIARDDRETAARRAGREP